MKKDVKSHTLNWFINRVGKEVVKGSANLFNQPIIIASTAHAKALYIAQKEKNYSFNEIY